MSMSTWSKASDDDARVSTVTCTPRPAPGSIKSSVSTNTHNHTPYATHARSQQHPPVLSLRATANLVSASLVLPKACMGIAHEAYAFDWNGIHCEACAVHLPPRPRPLDPAHTRASRHEGHAPPPMGASALAATPVMGSKLCRVSAWRGSMFSVPPEHLSTERGVEAGHWCSSHAGGQLCAAWLTCDAKVLKAWEQAERWPRSEAWRKGLR